MPFWNPFRRLQVDASRSNSCADTLRLVAHARVELVKPAKPRSNKLIGELLANLWHDNPIVSLLLHDALTRRPPLDILRLKASEQAVVDKEVLLIASMKDSAASALPEAYFMREWQAFTRQQTPRCPDSCEARYDAIVAGLRACLRHNMQELLQTDEIFPLDYVFDCLKIGSHLRAHELHDIHCEMLVATKQIMDAKPDGSRAARLQTLRRELYLNLRFQSQEKPILWEMLKDPATSEVFWPVVDAIGSNSSVNCVPQLLDALPYLSDNGKIHIIAALNRVGEASALPALQALARENTWPVAAVAATAVIAILRRNKSDAAQLLRAADNQHAKISGETLLRPAKESSSPARPEELLRPDLTPGPSPGRATRQERGAVDQKCCLNEGICCISAHANFSN